MGISFSVSLFLFYFTKVKVQEKAKMLLAEEDGSEAAPLGSPANQPIQEEVPVQWIINDYLIPCCIIPLVFLGALIPWVK